MSPKSNSPFWNQLSPEAVEDLLTQLKQHPDSFYDQCKTHFFPQLYDNAFSPIRKNIRPADVNPSGKTGLELGTSWGGVGFQISDGYDRFICTDLSDTAIDFLKIRKEVEGKSHIELVKIPPLEKPPLPFRDGSIDHVYCIGVLEWVGTQLTQQSPRDYQLQFLKEIRRLLSPQGRLFIGIENRFAFHYFAGHLDHPGLAYTSLMPRLMANYWVKHARKKPTHSYEDIARKNQAYRSYTYHLGGYATLFKQAGFSIKSVRLPIPNYRYPAHLLDGQDPQVIPLLRGEYRNLIHEATGLQKWGLAALYSIAKYRPIRFAHSYLFELLVEI